MLFSNRIRHRLVAHHMLLGVGCAASTWLIATIALHGAIAFRWSMATAYVALVLLTITLGIGPWHVLRSRRAPVSSDFRRDVGIWAGLVGLAHVAVGLQVHMGSMLLYFFVGNADGRWALRVDPFALTNWAGLAASCVLLLLLALSNDASLRRLGRRRWKSLQRLAYAVVLLVVLHGVVYQWLERRGAGWVVIFAATVALVAVLQAAGFRRARDDPFSGSRRQPATSPLDD